MVNEQLLKPLEAHKVLNRRVATWGRNPTWEGEAK